MKNLKALFALPLVLLAITSCSRTPNYLDLKATVYARPETVDGPRTRAANLSIDYYDLFLKLQNGVEIVQSIEKVQTNEDGLIELRELLSIHYQTEELVCYDVCVAYDDYIDYYCYDEYDEEYEEYYEVCEEEVVTYCSATAEECNWETRNHYRDVFDIATVSSQITYTKEGYTFTVPGRNISQMAFEVEEDDTNVITLETEFNTPVAPSGVVMKSSLRTSGRNYRPILRLKVRNEAGERIAQTTDLIQEQINLGRLLPTAMEKFLKAKNYMESIEIPNSGI